MNDQPRLPDEMLPECVVIEITQERRDRAERRRQEKAERKAKRLAAGKALPSAETLVLVISGPDRHQFREALKSAQATPPIPTRNQAAMAIFRMGLATLAALAEEQTKRDSLVQLAPAGTKVPSMAALAAARLGGGPMVAPR